jgi:hypothetical protein
MGQSRLTTAEQVSSLWALSGTDCSPTREGCMGSSQSRRRVGAAGQLADFLGGEINAAIEHAAAERGHPEAKAEGEKKAAQRARK